MIDNHEYLWQFGGTHITGAVPGLPLSDTGKERGFSVTGIMSELPGYRKVLGASSKREYSSGFFIARNTQNTGGHTMKKTQECAHEVPPIPSEDYKIIREESEDGTIIYRHPVGWLVDTCPLELDLLIGCMHERYDSLIALLDADDRQRFGIIFEALVAYQRRQLHEICEFISRCIGNIEVHYVDCTEATYRSGRVVGISIETPEALEARTGKRKEQKP